MNFSFLWKNRRRKKKGSKFKLTIWKLDQTFLKSFCSAGFRILFLGWSTQDRTKFQREKHVWHLLDDERGVNRLSRSLWDADDVPLSCVRERSLGAVNIALSYGVDSFDQCQWEKDLTFWRFVPSIYVSGADAIRFHPSSKIVDLWWHWCALPFLQVVEGNSLLLVYLRHHFKVHLSFVLWWIYPNDPAPNTLCLVSKIFL